MLDWAWVHPMETDTAWAGSCPEADQPLDMRALERALVFISCAPLVMFSGVWVSGKREARGGQAGLGNDVRGEAGERPGSTGEPAQSPPVLWAFVIPALSPKGPSR